VERRFFLLKEWMKDSVWFSDGLLHLNIGLAVFLALVLILRRNPRAVLLAWLAVAALQTLNEALDLWIGLSRSGRVRWDEMGKDFLATLFWPTVLLILWKPLARAGR
jgi:hypothetical protein